METAIQYDFFEAPLTELNIAQKRLDLLEEHVNKLRRGLFLRYGNIEKRCFRLENEFERVEKLLLKEVK